MNFENNNRNIFHILNILPKEDEYDDCKLHSAKCICRKFPDISMFVAITKQDKIINYRFLLNDWSWSWLLSSAKQNWSEQGIGKKLLQTFFSNLHALNKSMRAFNESSHNAIPYNIYGL